MQIVTNGKLSYLDQELGIAKDDLKAATVALNKAKQRFADYVCPFVVYDKIADKHGTRAIVSRIIYTKKKPNWRIKIRYEKRGKNATYNDSGYFSTSLDMPISGEWKKYNSINPIVW